MFWSLTQCDLKPMHPCADCLINPQVPTFCKIHLHASLHTHQRCLVGPLTHPCMPFTGKTDDTIWAANVLLFPTPAWLPNGPVWIPTRLKVNQLACPQYAHHLSARNSSSHNHIHSSHKHCLCPAVHSSQGLHSPTRFPTQPLPQAGSQTTVQRFVPPLERPATAAQTKSRTSAQPPALPVTQPSARPVSQPGSQPLTSHRQPPLAPMEAWLSPRTHVPMVSPFANVPL